ncbi:MAG: Holliday junction branch migration protein RuvA [Caldilineaceae bacterium]|nr:Holliday junction branch migration protein RuvA [Caldilineaceae bacterium]MCB9159690.1 Holliday junction branch migration protein RuvA [Caldilineaceae bacterium]
MIRLLRGAVQGRGKDYLLIELGGASGGMGFKVHVPDTMRLEAQLNDALTLHTYLQVREDALTLFGFGSEEELDLFELLLSVNGVGPKVALSTLSTLSPDALRMALANEEPAVIARVPGIGKRTAEKIVLELKDKVGPPAGALETLAQSMNTDGEVIEALIALGYSVVEAQRAIQALPDDVQGVEERLRLALGQFDR